MEKRGNRIVILGAGESGTGAAVLAKAKGFDVFVSDSSSIKPEYKKVLDKALALGLNEGFMQERSSAKEEYTPPFDLEGL